MGMTAHPLALVKGTTQHEGTTERQGTTQHEGTTHHFGAAQGQAQAACYSLWHQHPYCRIRHGRWLRRRGGEYIGVRRELC